MVEEKVENKCTGCTACVNVCPQNCIQMKENSEGFYYPNVDEKKCIKCKICINKCPILNKVDNEKIEETIYAAYSNDEENRKRSSSGGCFGEIAKKLLKDNTVIFGAGYDKMLNVVHLSVETEEELYKLQGSKYVQSKIGNDTFREIKGLLEKERKVLFSGTPCQVAGLKRFLGKEYENLYTIDVICHGVPSQKVFNKYIEEYKNDGKIKDIKFRDKTNGWKESSIKIDLENKESKIISAKEDKFMKIFLSNACLRESCYKCDFKDKNCESDISIGDFWGVNHIKPELNDNKGISILFVNTKKGMKLLEQCKENLVLEKIIDKKELIKYNPCIIKSVDRPKKRDEFFKELEQRDFDTIVQYSEPKQSIIKKIIKKIYILIKR